MARSRCLRGSPWPLVCMDLFPPISIRDDGSEAPCTPERGAGGTRMTVAYFNKGWMDGQGEARFVYEIAVVSLSLSLSTGRPCRVVCPPCRTGLLACRSAFGRQATL